MPAQLLAYRCPHCGKTMEVEPTSGDRVLTCPNLDCQKPFQLDMPRAQPAPALIVPPDMQEAPAAATAHHPVAHLTPALEPELLRIRPAMFRRYPIRYASLVGLMVVGMAGLIYAWQTNWPLAAVISALAILYGLFRMMSWWLRTSHTSLTITTRRAVLQTGIWSTKVIDVAHSEIQEVLVTQTWCNRLCGVGDLVIVGAEHKATVMQLLGVPRAEEVAALIRSRRQL
jgi:uncharacterized membrane protein YdbT with pleckstrin-like domain